MHLPLHEMFIENYLILIFWMVNIVICLINYDLYVGNIKTLL